MVGIRQCREPYNMTDLKSMASEVYKSRISKFESRYLATIYVKNRIAANKTLRLEHSKTNIFRDIAVILSNICKIVVSDQYESIMLL